MPSLAAAFSASPLLARPCSSASPFPQLTFLPPSLSFRFSSSFGQGLSASFPGLVFSQSRPARFGVFSRAATGKSLHDYTVKDIDGKDVSLDKFKGKILLIVNVASKCGLTQSNYSELTHLYEKYKPQGFEILAFPCNQFGGQEPGSNTQIKDFACTRFKASSLSLIKWMLMDQIQLLVVERYPPTTSPFQIENDVKRLLAA
ncbi:hypothetical protein MLD38_014566 [Melastoma candidum]|uniref:Uncharacterized protein n=1 Tax=Melastoma candidum TaxID=119954 RepID=A0ACB9RED1_9MYRT|nr:hypothetical protein MLD38_014566 [Melastoma candidum]